MSALLHRSHRTLRSPPLCAECVWQVNFWPGGYTPRGAGPTPSFCDNTSYAWGLDFTPEERSLAGDIIVGPSLSCVPLDLTTDVAVSDGSFTAVTYSRMQPLNTSLWQNRPVGWPLVVDDAGTVIRLGNFSRYHRFTDAHETVRANMIHVVSASFIPNGIANPRTIIRDHRGVVRATFEAGFPLTGITMRHWLDYVVSWVDAMRPAGVRGHTAPHASKRPTATHRVCRWTTATSTWHSEAVCRRSSRVSARRASCCWCGSSTATCASGSCRGCLPRTLTPCSVRSACRGCHRRGATSAPVRATSPASGLPSSTAPASP